MKRFAALFLMIFMIFFIAGGLSDASDNVILEAVIHLDGMELIRFQPDSYEMTENGLIIVRIEGISYITSPSNVVIIEYDLDAMGHYDALPDGNETYIITGKR